MTPLEFILALVVGSGLLGGLLKLFVWNATQSAKRDEESRVERREATDAYINALKMQVEAAIRAHADMAGAISQTGHEVGENRKALELMLVEMHAINAGVNSLNNVVNELAKTRTADAEITRQLLPSMNKLTEAVTRLTSIKEQHLETIKNNETEN